VEADEGLVGGTGTVVAWSSRRLKRVVSSTRSAELLTTLENAHAGILVSVMVAEMEGHIPWAVRARGATAVVEAAARAVPIICTTDARDTVTALRTEREIEAEKDLNPMKQQLQSVGWVPDADMPVDSLAKKTMAAKREMRRKLIRGESATYACGNWESSVPS
jgi:hypothetical protein